MLLPYARRLATITALLCCGVTAVAQNDAEVSDEISEERLRQQDLQTEQELIEKPILVEEDFAFEKANRAKSSQILRLGAKNRADENLLRRHLKFKIGTMTMPAELQRAHYHREKFQKTLESAGSRLNPAAKKKLRELLNREVLELCESLLDNHFLVRLQAVEIIAGLDAVPEVRKGQRLVSAAQPYVPSHIALLKVATDREQTDSVRIPATRGLLRILADKRLAPMVQTTIAKALAEELEKRSPGIDGGWFEKRLCDALGRVKAPEPKIIPALMGALKDDQRHFRVRVAAAYALGQTSGVKGKDVANGAAVLALKMAKAQMEKPRNAEWQRFFWKVYLGLNSLNSAGAGTQVKQVYDLIIPLAKHVIETPGKPFAPVIVKPLQDWVKKNGLSKSNTAENLANGSN